MPFSSGEGGLLQLNQQDFDFNVQFEQLFFSIVPSVLFIVTSLWRTLSQARKPTVVRAPVFQLIKLGAITTYVGLELSLLILAAVGSFHITGVFIAASVLKLVAALLMVILSLIDHSKSPRPSVLLNSYLFLTLLLDAAQARTLFLSSADKPELTYSCLFTAAIALKVGILLLEAQRKARWVEWDEKNHSPEETSGIFSLGVFFWLNKIFLMGYSKVLKIEDLYPLDSAMDGQSLHDEFARNMDYAKLKGDRLGLAKVLISTLKVPLLLPVLPRLALLAFTFCQPLFIEKLLEHLSAPPDSAAADPNIGYGLIGASLLIYLGISISSALTWYLHNRALAMARSVLVTETYAKATRARIGGGGSSSSSSSSSDGSNDDDSAAVTLMSTDMERIRVGFFSVHEIWAGLVQAALAAWMLHNQLGPVFVAPIVFVTVCAAGLLVLLPFAGDSQRKWMQGVQRRVGLTATVIAGMKNLKISGLTSAISDHVQKLRVEELGAGARYRAVTIVASVFGFASLFLAPPITFALAQRTMDATKMFTSLSYMLLLLNPLLLIFDDSPQFVSGLACLGRIQKFLEGEDRSDFRRVANDVQRTDEKNGSSGGQQCPIVIQDGHFGWKDGESALKDIHTSIPKSSLTMIIGPVGSGKSTLCKALLGEIPFSKGSVLLNTRYPHIGFCDQTAFLSNGTIKENITGFSAFDPNRYADVVDATALGFDLRTLPQGDDSNVGSDGITLSGGQKQRVSLARALYLHSDLLVLDDIFSGLDADTEEQVFRKVFGPHGLLRRRGSTVVLCTHSIRHLHAADHIVALEHGTIAEQGTFAELMGRPQGYVQRLGLTLTAAGSEEKEEVSAEIEPKRAVPDALTASAAVVQPPPDEASRQSGDVAVYAQYFKSMGLLTTALSFFFATLLGFFNSFGTIWLKYWSEDLSSPHPSRSYAFYAGIYAFVQFGALASLLLVGIALLIVAVRRAGAHLHEEALRTLVRAPLRFFTTTDTGVITNLFSQDLNLVDTELPMSLLMTMYFVFFSIGQAAVMLTSSPFLAISYPFLGALIYIVQKFYLRTSRQLRLLDLEAKSPLYTHFIDTLKGITTLRAFGDHITGFLPQDIAKNTALINTSQRPAYLLAMIQQWLALVLNLIVTAMAALLTILALQLRSNSGFAGASLVAIMDFGQTLAGIVIFYTRLETSLGAIARLRRFERTVRPEDREGEWVVPPREWPLRGAIELKGVCASYDPDDEVNPSLALRDIHLSISPGEKLAICGRTGSGKSSLLAFLLKLLDPVSSSSSSSREATIDDTPLSQIDRPSLRERLIAVPQEAVFLPDGTSFASNLDPFNLSTPEECISVLQAVGMWKYVSERHEDGGVHAPMSAGSLSAGQRQLLSLGRAVLKRRVRSAAGGEGGGGVLLLDEVSSSVDAETERAMGEVIAREFASYTVVAVSHRLEMIMGFDRVVVMDKGAVVEVGRPEELVGVEGSRFGELVRASSGRA